VARANQSVLKGNKHHPPYGFSRPHEESPRRKTTHHRRNPTVGNLPNPSEDNRAGEAGRRRLQEEPGPNGKKHPSPRQLQDPNGERRYGLEQNPLLQVSISIKSFGYRLSVHPEMTGEQYKKSGRHRHKSSGHSTTRQIIFQTSANPWET
jgi:hypothetical protein